MRVIKKYLLFIFIGCFTLMQAQKLQSSYQAITNAIIHIGNGQLINNGYIVFRGDTIVETGQMGSFQNHYQADVLDVEGSHVYPGFIAMNTILGLTEIDAVRATRDFAETGTFNPNVRTAIAFNAESKIIQTVRSNGVLLAEIAPRGGIFSGTSSVMQLDGWNWEDALVKSGVGIHLNWPRYFNRTGWWAEPGPVKKNEKYQENVDKIIQFIEEAKAYCALKDKTERNLRYEAMCGLFTGEKKLFVHAEFAHEITDAVTLLSKYNIPLVIVGGYESWKVTGLLKDKKVPVVLRRIHELPQNDSDPLHLPFEIPYKLYQAGVEFCFQNEGDMEAMQTRNLPFLAGTAAAYGLPYEDAIKALTLTPARILGIDQQFGSLEKGKSATFFISKGDVMDMRTSKITHIYIRGKAIETENFQYRLYEKYARKYGLDPVK